MDPLGFTSHDHATCVEVALAAAEAACAEAGLRLTPTRRRVLALLLEQHRAVGAYDILDALRAEGRAARPPTAYRALDFLTAHGFVHRIERLNAFVACACPGQAHDPLFLICRGCDAVAEAQADARTVASPADAAGFAVERTVLEAEGLCPDCRTDAVE
jgi:Fur family zinc uptake transcriptional regulator